MQTQLILNESKKTITINGIETKFPKKGIAIFKILLRNKNKMVLRNDILLAIWEVINYYTTRSMDVYMCKIRKALCSCEGINIENKHGEGFTMLVSDSVEIITVEKAVVI